MNDEPTQLIPWWMKFHLWGLDLPLVALSWGYAYTELMDLSMLTDGPLMLLMVAVWMYSISSRLITSFKSPTNLYKEFYRKNMVLICFLVLCAALASTWMLFFYLSMYLLEFYAWAIILLVISGLPAIRHFVYAKYLLRGMAFAMGCAAPAFFFTILLHPVGMLTNAPILYLGILIFLFLLERHSWTVEDITKRDRFSLVVTMGLVILFLVCITASHSMPYIERSFSFTLLIACAFLEFIDRMRKYWRTEVLIALSWPLMGLPPLIGIFLFEGQIL